MMKKFFFPGIILILVLQLLGCTPQHIPATQSTLPSTTPTATVESSAPTEETIAPTTEPTTEPTTPEHSQLYIPGLSVDTVVAYFNEVCLNAEIINAGDPTKLQKWVTPIRYVLHDTYTDADKDTFDTFVNWLNTVDGFPGMQEAKEHDLVNLHIHFCDPAEYLRLMGDNFSGTDGGITFWYNGANEIYNAIIAYRTDIAQEVRNSVILEEIYNGLGPINDTELRPDSVIYAGYSTPQSISPVDALILKLLYHPQMQCGMDPTACEAVIRQLYY